MATSDWRPAYKPDDIIGYEYRSEDGDFHAFFCAYHDDDWEGWSPVTAKQAVEGYYTCERIGCEFSWWPEHVRIIEEEPHEQ